MAVSLTACAASDLRDAARTTFETMYACQRERVASREDLAPDAIEVAGCGEDVIYACSGMISNDAISIPASCRPTSWCAGPGCAADHQAVARTLFADDVSCPQARVVADRVANPDQPSADIAADPQRLEMWRTREQALTKDRVFVSARGCGDRALYACVDRPPQSPACTRWSAD